MITNKAPAAAATSEQTVSDLTTLKEAIDDSLCADRHWLRRQARNWSSLSQGARAACLARLQRSQQRVTGRRQQKIALTWNQDLPVVQKKDDIARLIEAHQVVVIAGETGSGKATQIPKICLQLGRGLHGLIGHTQPRRLAASAVANRIAEELDTVCGEQVGYQVRFTDKVGEQSRVKLMTDGILLAEIASDRYLNQYDTLIIDEAHERSLNIDFLLGYLKLLLPKRPDLKVVITSATLDVERFSRHFGGPSGPAPIMTVSGRSWPVELLYRPLLNIEVDDDSQESRQLEGIYRALTEIEQRQRDKRQPTLGDVLVFLASEREIRDTEQYLNRRQLRDTEIVPLYARLSAAEQNRVFLPHSGRRVILATNVAETSLTVPGIHYVIDPGTARISRYSVRSKVQRLPIEPVSKASANRRKGRCGRIAAGTCIRLYEESDFNARPDFTDAEILRTNLAAVILQMLKLGLDNIAHFPFVDPPDGRAVNDGYLLLQELGALDHTKKITAIGRQLAQLLVDPRIGRMVLAAHNFHSLTEVLVIASALSIQDPRQKNNAKAPVQADNTPDFKDKQSDFVTFVNLWNWYQKQRQTLSGNRLRKLCQAQNLSVIRLREWRDLHAQLLRICQQLSLHLNSEPATYSAIHQALLTGLLGHLGQKTEKGSYQGARNRTFHIFPGSVLFKRSPQWIMAETLVETSRLYGRTVAKIESQWIESLAGHLLKKSWSEPHWSQKRAQVLAYEKASLYGLVVYSQRKVSYSAIDPAVAREIFIREGLVAGHYHCRAPFRAHNEALIADIEGLEAKSRRQDILVDPQALFLFFDQRLGEEVVSGASFEQFRKQAERHNPTALYLTRDDLMQHGAESVTAVQYPNHLKWDGMELPLSYCFAPGAPDDGVTLTIPAPLLPHIPQQRLDWLVPGVLENKVVALIRALPKQWRKHFVPVPDTGKQALKGLTAGERPLTEALGQQLHRMTGIRVPPESWQTESLAPHLQMNIRVIDDREHCVGQGRQLSALRTQLADTVSASLVPMTCQNLEKEGIVRWDFGELVEEVCQSRAGLQLRSYPGLVAQSKSVDLRLFENRHTAQQKTVWGLARLLHLALPEQVRTALAAMPDLNRITVMAVNMIPKGALIDSIVLYLLCHAFGLEDTAQWPRNEETFKRLITAHKSEMVTTAEQLNTLLLTIFSHCTDIKKRLKGSVSLAHSLALGDIKQQLDHLLFDGFLQVTPWLWLTEFPRYLKAISLRLDKLNQHGSRDRVHTAELRELWEAWTARHQALNSQNIHDNALFHYRWLLEEYRVSLFAQTLKTRVPVSAKRLKKAWEEISTQ